MLYYLAKFLQATGLVVILFGFIKDFPKLMDHKVLAVSILLFLSGWVIEAKLLKR